MLDLNLKKQVIAMTERETLEKIKAFFAADRFAVENGIEIIEAAPGYARCRCEIRQGHLNAGGTVQGGMLFTLGDFTFAAAANAGGIATVTLDSAITFHRPAKGNTLMATAREVTAGRTICHYQVDICDELGTKVATLAVNGYQKGENHIFD